MTEINPTLPSTPQIKAPETKAPEAKTVQTTQTQPAALTNTQPKADCFNYAGKFNENLQYHSKSVAGAMFGITPYIVGDINGKHVQIEVSKKDIKGMIGNEKIELKADKSIFSSAINISGKYGDKTVDLSAKPGILTNKYELTGKINDKEIKLKAPCSVEPYLNDADIITFATALAGRKLVIVNNNFVGVGLSKAAQEERNQEALMLATYGASK